MSRPGRKPFYVFTDAFGSKLEVTPGLTAGKIRLLSKDEVNPERRVVVTLPVDAVRTLAASLENWIGDEED